MGRLVMKFGGTSVANIERIRNVARHVKREVDAGHDVAVVVSAMSGKTNELVEWCREASPMHDAREYDAVVASGEQVTSGLLAIALQALGIQARSWQGWQIPIKTSDAHASARILEIDGAELINRFKDRKEVAVIAGFQGINPADAGSPRSAAAAPIPRRWRSPPPSTPTAATSTPTSTASIPPIRGWSRRRAGSTRIAFEDMLELASQGAKVLQVRSVELGMVHNMPIFVRSSFDKPEDIDPHGTPPGTLICSEEEIMESHVVTGIAFSKDEAQISVRQIAGQARRRRGDLRPAGGSQYQRRHDRAERLGGRQDHRPHLHGARLRLCPRPGDHHGAKGEIGYARLDSATDVAKVSVIGSGMRSHAGVAAQAFAALAARNINIRAITTSEIKFSVLIDAAYTELAVRTLHTLYGLDQA